MPELEEMEERLNTKDQIGICFEKVARARWLRTLIWSLRKPSSPGEVRLPSRELLWAGLHFMATRRANQPFLEFVGTQSQLWR